MEYVYHGSQFAPDKMGNVIQRRVSTHGQNWVYAGKDETTAMLFSGNGDDFDYRLIGEGSLEKPYVIFERYPGAIEKANNMKTYIYMLNGENFKENQTPWNAEVVSDRDETILSVKEIDNLYEQLKDSGKVTFVTFEERMQKIKETGIDYKNAPPIDNSDLLPLIEEKIFKNTSLQLEEQLEKEPENSAIIYDRYNNFLNMEMQRLSNMYPLIQENIFAIVAKYNGSYSSDKESSRV